MAMSIDGAVMVVSAVVSTIAAVLSYLEMRRRREPKK
jgi:hypothetical protein